MAKQRKKQSKRASVTKMLSRASVTKMLSRDTDATVIEIMKSTGWREHSCRAFLTGVRKTGKLLKEQRSDGKTAYRLDVAQAEANVE